MDAGAILAYPAAVRRRWEALGWAVALTALAAGMAGSVRARPYQGVAPDARNDPPRAEHLGGKRLMTWPGFQMLPDGGSRVFIQVTQEPLFETRDAPDRFVILLERTGVHLRNNRRPLETRHFNTPVKRVRVERRRQKVAVILELRAPAPPKVRTRAGEDGRFHYLMVDFPPGDWTNTPSR